MFGKNKLYLNENYNDCHRLDTYESNHKGDRQTDGQIITEVRKVLIHEFVRSNVMIPGVTERRALMTWVSRNVGY